MSICPLMSASFCVHAKSTNCLRTRPVETKWEKFAREKGIVKRKRSKLVFDETSGEWVRRFGFNKASRTTNREADAMPRADKGYSSKHDTIVVEEKGLFDGGKNKRQAKKAFSSSGGGGGDPFNEQEKAKKERVAKNERQRLANIARSGGARDTSSIPTSGMGAMKTPDFDAYKGSDGRKLGRMVTANDAMAGGAGGGGDFTSTLDRGKKKRKELSNAVAVANKATMSIGKFNKVSAGDKAFNKKVKGERRGIPADVASGHDVAKKALKKLLIRKEGEVVN